jgi:hypothetical protein
MIPPPAPVNLGTFRVVHEGPFVAGIRTTVQLEYVVGPAGLSAGARIRVGVPNTGWEQPVPPQQRYWDELVQGAARRLAPFHPVNTTASVEAREGAVVVLDVMERMLTPDEDPAIAYWRWWITATIEGSNLKPGDVLRITYGDRRFGSEGVRVQTFIEDQVNVVAFIQPTPDGEFFQIQASPWYLDVIAGPASRANVVARSTFSEPDVPVRISVTDACQCRPADDKPVLLDVAGQAVRCRPGESQSVRFFSNKLSGLSAVEPRSKKIWGKVNPSIALPPDGLRLFWGDLHAQSEHHVMHSQKMDFRQGGWSKGISCGSVDDCYAYAREIAMLDFVALTDQGACLTSDWEMCQAKVREHHRPGEFVTFKAYEAGAPVGHRNVIYVTDTIEPPLDAGKFSNFHPPVLYDYYRERRDVILIPHHVKTWTDWSYHDPHLEPVMEIYSCWGQSEWPGTDLWAKGITPGGGAQAAFQRGYRMGMMASSDNHVGMPGRSYFGDRQAHTPFKGGLCAVWARELSREAVIDAIRSRRCYGTTGSRMIVRFSMDDHPMGSAYRPAGEKARASIEVHATGEIRLIEVVGPRGTAHIITCRRGETVANETIELPVVRGGYYYVRITQSDGERAWTSPIFFD